jgi:molecular chaperone HscB
MNAAITPDPFALFDLEPSFDLDLGDLERRFFAKNRDFHPDRFVTASAAQRVAALSRSRALNDAYQVLRKPVPRAEYLLTRYGGSIGDNERLDPRFLQEILELREELADARHAGQLDAVTRLQGAMMARRKAAISALPPLFLQLAAHPKAMPETIPDAMPDALVAIKHHLIVLRYLDRYLEECDAALDPDFSDSETKGD